MIEQKLSEMQMRPPSLFKSFSSHFSKKPSLIPLVAVVGGSVAYGLWYIGYIARRDPTVVIDKYHNPFPWNRIKQNENVKFYTVNHVYFEEQENAPHHDLESILLSRPE